MEDSQAHVNGSYSHRIPQLKKLVHFRTNELLEELTHFMVYQAIFWPDPNIPTFWIPNLKGKNREGWGLKEKKRDGRSIYHWLPFNQNFVLYLAFPEQSLGICYLVWYKGSPRKVVVFSHFTAEETEVLEGSSKLPKAIKQVRGQALTGVELCLIYKGVVSFLMLLKMGYVYTL